MPSQWNLGSIIAGQEVTGTALYGDDSQYTVKQKYDSRLDSMVNVYYYWVKNKTTVPENAVVTRKNSASYVSNLISNPHAFGFKYYAVTDTTVSYTHLTLPTKA